MADKIQVVGIKIIDFKSKEVDNCQTMVVAVDNEHNVILIEIGTFVDVM